MATLSVHAQQQIASRGFDPAEILGKVEALEGKIKQVGRRSREVRVVVKHQQYTVIADGSNGNLVVACVDSATMNVITVMLQNKYQMEQKIKETPYIR